MARKKNQASEMDVGEKQALPLAQRLSELATDVNALKCYLDVSAQAVNQYKLGISRPSLENLCKIADFYDVSTDYLLGRTETKSRDSTVQAVCAYTGLSEQAVEILHKSRTDLKLASFEMPELNALLCEPDFWTVLELLSIYRVQCHTAMSRPIMIENSTDKSEISQYKKELRQAEEDKDLCLFRIQKTLFAIAQKISITGGEKNAINPKKGNCDR